MKRNPLQAFPTDTLYSATTGVDTHPGFHTGDDPLVAAPYAQIRFEQSRMKDYPVILELNMTGLYQLTDYDAEITILPYIRDVVKYNVKDVHDVGAAIDDIADFSKYGEFYDRAPNSAIDSLFQSHPSQRNPSAALLYALEDLPEQKARKQLITLARGGTPDPEILMQITGQYRYCSDIGADRVSAVYYMTPFWPDLLEEGENDREIEAVLRGGFEIADPYLPIESIGLTKVYTGVPPGKRPEYHGTSLRTVRQALPEIPLPPPPPLDMSKITG